MPNYTLHAGAVGATNTCMREFFILSLLHSRQIYPTKL
jgi:hypothetical protein